MWEKRQNIEEKKNSSISSDFYIQARYQGQHLGNMHYDAWPLAYTEHGENPVNHSLKTSIHWNIDFHKVLDGHL